ncbi:MAG: nucleotide exchange factor GrpE [Thermodesulfobacteriota bacterium]
MKENEEMEPQGAGPGEEGAEAGSIQELPEQEIERLKGEIEAKEKEAKANLDKYLRSVADLENFRKRAQKEISDSKCFANETLISELLPVLDNFERALAHADGDGGSGSVRDGIKLIIDQMFGVLRKFGLEEVDALGQRFDPGLHHAISETESADAEPGTVVEVFQKGYYLKGKLVRPAMVAVARAHGDPAH